ncbi:MAG: ribonuclease J, partial [Bacillota bacterium]
MSKEPKVAIIPLGGLGEIGKNMMAVKYGENILVVDCGMMFPEEELLGIDVVIPDITYLLENREQVRAIVLT